VTFPFANLPDNLAAFCDTLRRDHRFRLGPRELQDAARVLEITTITDERAVRNALRPVLSGSLDDVRVFDRAFDRFFLTDRSVVADLESRGSPNDDRGVAPKSLGGAGNRFEGRDPAQSEVNEANRGAETLANASDGDAESAGLLRLSYSPLEAEGAAVDLEPLDEVWRTAAAVFVSRVHLGLSRRWRPAPRGRRFDLRRTLRTSLHTSGDVVTPRWRAHPRRRPRIVLLIDGSRSMESATWPALQAAVALTAVASQTETFTFSTALCRLTPGVRRAVAGERCRLRLRHAWGGGTTIGVCLEDDHERRARRRPPGAAAPDDGAIVSPHGCTRMDQPAR
jgi:uncharacterized protein with von Willebrand factor type A (vWA) domain